MYGYEMIETLMERSQNVFELKAGTLYPLLHSLESRQLLRVYEKEAGGKTRKYYSITRQGLKALEDQEEEWKTYAQAVTNVLTGRRDCMKAEEYLSVLTDQMRCKMAREAVRDELLCPIEDQKTAFISEGMEKSEAEEAAVREMGDPVETGNEMDRIHRPKMAWGMIALITVLSITGYAIQRAMEAKVCRGRRIRMAFFEEIWFS